ncbi:MAG: flagellar hook-length control protein FliK [Silicimonas sp.]|nr:flagellar hook-length control protein FliK [Silicimonas sp.]
MTAMLPPQAYPVAEFVTRERWHQKDVVPIANDIVPGLAGHEGSEIRRIPDQLSARLEMQAKPVVSQLIQAARSAVDGMIEVRLSPEELGRVRLAMTSGDLGMSVQVTAERPETLELIRRNIELLAAELQDMGFADLSFSFGKEGGSENSPASSDADDGDTTTGVNVFQLEDAVPGLPVRSDGRVDLRL